MLEDGGGGTLAHARHKRSTVVAIVTEHFVAIEQILEVVVGPLRVERKNGLFDLDVLFTIVPLHQVEVHAVLKLDADCKKQFSNLRAPKKRFLNAHP